MVDEEALTNAFIGIIVICKILPFLQYLFARCYAVGGTSIVFDEENPEQRNGHMSQEEV